MPMGFFTDAEVEGKVRLPLQPQCGRCQLLYGCKSPKMPVFGKGRKGILVAGEAPGRTEDEQNRPFIGPSGQVLKEALDKCGIDMDRDCWLTNSLACWPGKGNVIKDPKAVDYCRPLVVKAIETLKPTVTILTGAVPVKSVIGWLWKDDVGQLARWTGWRIPSQQLNCWVTPVWHPSYIMRKVKGGERDAGLVQMLWERDLKAAVGLAGKRPWDAVPDYKGLCDVVIDPDEAAKRVDAMTAGDGPLAWDLECLGLKPDNDAIEIVCCSVSDGKRSVAYPWHGAAIKATKRMLLSNVPKYGFSAKYEQRFMLRKLGLEVKGWDWDGMLAAHVLDNRRDICNLSFQSFARLGYADHKDPMKAYMKSAGSNLPNRLREAPLPQLLRYNALDSLLEWYVAKHQKAELKRRMKETKGE